MRALDIAGQNFGRLTVISRVGSNAHKQALWRCVCICGGAATTTSAKLVGGHTQSCGCIKADRMRAYRHKPMERQQCAAPGCDRLTEYPKCLYCGMHSARVKRTGSTEITRRPNGSGSIGKNGYVDIHVNGRRTYEHIHVAENALGRPMPHGAVVHHVNENKTDNRPENLVICPNEAYHRLLHVRMKALLNA
jgi:hypothetical protein